MNANLPPDHPSVRYYDSDYPGEISTIASNLDPKMEYQGIAYDVARYLELVREDGTLVLELCCGTGRVAIPFARAGHRVLAVDASPGMLARFRENLAREKGEVAARITLIEQDVANLSLSFTDLSLIIIPFNSLLCVTDFSEQLQVLQRAAAHLAPHGRLAIDVVNPLGLPVAGDVAPKPFFTRRSELNGREYTRFAALGPFDATQRQRLYGWYDEIDEGGVVRRTPYELYWRPIFRFELELMLDRAGLEIFSIEGGHRHEPFTSESPRMFVIAVKLKP